MALAELEQVPGPGLYARICIIGAGAAGIALACELDRSPFSALLIEAGGLKPSEDVQDHYRGEATPPHPAPVQFRRAAFGGTTALWGGRCVPLDPIDLEPRSYVAGSGWPIRYEELARHYPRAMSYCDAGQFDFTLTGSLRNAQPTIAGLAANDLVIADRIERYSLPTDFGKRYRHQIAQSPNITALLQARCLKLIKAAGDDRITGAELVDRRGRKIRVNADVFVLATGGIEVPRLLMLSDSEGNGLGNRYDCLGRYYTCHFEHMCGRLVPNGTSVSFHFERTTDGVYCRRQLRFNPEILEQHRLRNMVFRLHFPNYCDAEHRSSVMSAIYLAKSLLVPEYRSILQHSAAAAPSPTSEHMRNVLADLPGLARFGWDWLFRIQLAERKLPYTLVPNADGSFPLEFNCEQTPLASNRVTLGRGTDAHGLRRVQIDWRLCKDDLDSAYRAFVLLRDRLNSHGSCKVHFEDGALKDDLQQSHPLGGHHIGTARMASSERGGVVDRNGAVFGLPNLFIASSAVFPTSGHANPTLSIVALAIRLAEHLKAGLASLRSIPSTPSTAAATAEVP